MLHPNAWQFNKDSFKNWGEYIKHGFKPAVIKSAEMWPFEILLLFVSWVGKIELASYMIVIATTTFLNQGPKGISVAAYKLVGHALENRHPYKAQKYAFTAMSFGMISGAIFASIFVFLGDRLGEIFTENEAVIANFTKLSPLIAILVLTDHTQVVEAGILKAMGKQLYSELTVIIAMIVIGVPTSYYLAFKVDWGITGAYLGIIISIAI